MFRFAINVDSVGEFFDCRQGEHLLYGLFQSIYHTAEAKSYHASQTNQVYPFQASRVE